jgi:hypothetical protein
MTTASASLDVRIRDLDERESMLSKREQALAQREQAIEKRENAVLQHEGLLQQRESAVEQREKASTAQGTATGPPADNAQPRAALTGVKWPARPAWKQDRSDDDDEEEESYASIYARSKKPDATNTLVEEDRAGKAQAIVKEAQVSATEIRDQYAQPWKSEVNVVREDPSLLVSQASTSAGELRQQFSQPWKSEQNVVKEDPSLLVGQASANAGELRGQFEPQARPQDTRQEVMQGPRVQLRQGLFGQSKAEAPAQRPEKKSLEELP